MSDNAKSQAETTAQTAEKGKKSKGLEIKEKMNIGTKNLSMLFFCASIVAVVLRTLQMTRYIDPATGFYTGGNAVIFILYAILTASALIFCGISFLSKDCAKLSFYNTKNKAIGFAGVLMGLAFLYDSADSLFGGLSSLGQVSSSNYTAFMTSGTIPTAIQSFFAFFSAIFLFILAKDQFKGTSSASKRKFLATMPVWWAGARLISRFIRQISFVEVSDLLLELLMIGAMLFVFMSMAQVVTGVYSDGFRWRIFGLGYTASLLALATSLPRLILSFVDGGAYINAQHPFYVCDLVFAIFAVTVILCHKPQSIEPAGDEQV